jgi:DNA-binding transcriptional LysR family regulator
MEYKNLPELSGWAALRAVVEKGGVSEAASVLHVGQPAVTKRLRALESCYGLPLIERVGGRLRLTAAGEKVYLLAVQTLDRQAALREDLQSLVGGKTALRLEVSLAIGEHLLPGLLLQFAESHPQYQVKSRLGYGRAIQTHLATHMTDLALLENAPDHPDILVQKWMEDELWLVAGPTHALAPAGVVTVEQLPKLDYVLRERRSAIRDTLEESLKQIGIERLKVAMEVGSTEAIVEILGHGRHVSFLPRFAVDERVRNGKLVHIKVTGFRIMRTLWIARHRGSLDHPVAEAFIRMLRQKSAAKAA